jgi:tetratricopeptide (TPR) repeat protein
MKTLTHFILTLISLTLTVQAEDAASLIQKGDVYDKQFKHAEALKYYLPAEQESPQDAELLIRITRQYIYAMADEGGKSAKLALGQKALSYAERAAQADSRNSNAQVAIALSLGKLGQIQGNKEKVAYSKRIKECAEKATRLDPGNDYAWHILGRWHQGVAGANSILLSLARLIYGEIPEGTNETSVKCFEKARAINPAALVHHIELGRTYAQMGLTAEARASLEKGLAMPNRERDDPETKGRGRKALEKLP